MDEDVPGRSGGGRAGIERGRRGAGLVEAPVVQGPRPAWAAERVAAVRRETVAGTAANARAIFYIIDGGKNNAYESCTVQKCTLFMKISTLGSPR